MRNTDEIRELANKARDGYAKELRKFAALAKANGYFGKQGGMIYQRTAEAPVSGRYTGIRGWQELASHVWFGAVVLLDQEALAAQAQREIDEKEAVQATPAYHRFQAAVFQGKSYQAALDILHAEAAADDAARAAFDWSTVQAGDVLVWKPTGGKQSRRMLVESVDGPINPSSTFRMAWGVELTAALAPRLRKGVRNWSRQRPYLVWDKNVTEVIRGDQRAADTAARVEARRVERAREAVSY